MTNSSTPSVNSGNPFIDLAQLQQVKIGQGGYLNNTVVNDAVVTDPTLIHEESYLQEPEGHFPFDPLDVITLPAVIGPIWYPIVTLTMEQGYDGVVLFYSCNVESGGFTQGSGDVIWQLIINGRPVKNFQQILTERGSLAQPRPLARLRVYSGDTLIFQVQHPQNPVMNGAIISASLSGYQYPSTGS